MKKQLEDMDVIDNFLFNEITSDNNIGEAACREITMPTRYLRLIRIRL